MKTTIGSFKHGRRILWSRGRIETLSFVDLPQRYFTFILSFFLGGLFWIGLWNRRRKGSYSLIFFLFRGRSAGTLAQVLPLNATGAAAAERRSRREVDVLLRIQTYDERRNVHDLLTDAEK